MASIITLDRSVELSRALDGGTVVCVVVAVDANGDLIVGHDAAQVTDTLPGPHTFDHWVVVGDEHKDVVLLHLLRERFADVPAPTTDFMEWLQEHAVPHEVCSAAGEPRGPARVTPMGRRRNAARRPGKTRAGP